MYDRFIMMESERVESKILSIYLLVNQIGFIFEIALPQFKVLSIHLKNAKILLTKLEICFLLHSNRKQLVYWIESMQESCEIN